jgi:hypothetical protein
MVAQNEDGHEMRKLHNVNVVDIKIDNLSWEFRMKKICGRRISVMVVDQRIDTL